MNTALTELNELRFFQTVEHSCGYLPEKDAQNVFVDPEQDMDAGLFSFLSSFGFRRSGSHIYKPHCASCQACLPLRELVDQFIPSKSQRRCLNRNSDLRAFLLKEITNDECY